MAIAIAMIAVLLAVLGMAGLFLRADPRAVAANVRIALPVGLGAAGAGILAIGRTGMGLLILAVAAGLYALLRRQAKSLPLIARQSIVRTAALEMELDHDTGILYIADPAANRVLWVNTDDTTYTTTDLMNDPSRLEPLA